MIYRKKRIPTVTLERNILHYLVSSKVILQGSFNSCREEWFTCESRFTIFLMIGNNYEKNRKSKDHEAVMDLITRANREQMEEEKKMCDALKELFAEELKEADEKGIAKGMELAKRIFVLNAQGMAVEEIARECGVAPEQVEKLIS